MDIVYHGVPSLLAWEKYCDKMTKNKELKAISFRDKTYGWKRFSLKFIYTNDDEYIKDLRIDEFIQGFLKNLYLFPFGYASSFKTFNCQNDIILADFRGIQNVLLIIYSKRFLN